MGRKSKRGRALHGIVLLDKPAGLSSNHALQRVKRLLDAAKAGHSGTLDPFATGLLPICLGEATKFSSQLLDADKTYVATVQLGLRTDTGDCEGEVVARAPVPALSEAEVTEALQRFTGDIEQTPPMYSALKKDGRRLYELARAGETVDRPPRPVTIHTLELLSFDAEQLRIRVQCSKGTYIRVLAEDIARALGTEGHCAALRRTGVAPFDSPEMLTLEAIEADPEAALAQLLPVDAALAPLPRLALDQSQTQDLQHGRQICQASEPGTWRAYSPEGRFLGLVDADGQHLRPRRLVATDNG